MSASTVRRRLREDALKPWQHRSWIFIRDPDFRARAQCVLDLYARTFDGVPLGEDEYVVSSDEKTSVQARCRCHPTLAPGRARAMRVNHEYGRRAVEQSPAAVRVWREVTWPAIRAKVKAEGGEVLFADQVGIRSHQVTGRTWGAEGCTLIVRRSGNRFSVNAMSAISTKGRMHFMVFTEPFDADVMCRFLDRLAGHFDHKVHLVVDGHSAYRSRRVRTWLADHPDRIELHFLPSYSPELNPTSWSTPTSDGACRCTAGPTTRPNSLPRPAGSSPGANASHTSSAATSAARTSATSSNRTY
jgi:hypothetical protein